VQEIGRTGLEHISTKWEGPLWWWGEVSSGFVVATAHLYITFRNWVDVPHGFRCDMVKMCGK
jgi:hypothetical protein